MTHRTIAGWGLALMVALAAVPAMAQRDDGPILLPRKQPVKPAAATLLVICDLACNWKLDGEAKGRIEPGGSAKATVLPGQHQVIAATEDGADRVTQMCEGKAGTQTAVNLALQPVRDARLKSEQQARDKAAKEQQERPQPAINLPIHPKPGPNSPTPGGQGTAAQIAASDARLKALRNAAADWRGRGPSAGRAVLEPLDAITPLDQARLGPMEQSAQSVLLQVKEHFVVRDAGLNESTKGQLRILVEPAGGGEKVGVVARVLSDNLGKAGFLLANGTDDADLRVWVAVQGIDKLSEDYTDGWRNLIYEANISVSASWTADNSVLLSEQFPGKGRERDEDGAKNAALRDAIDQVVQQFDSMAAR